jgi:calcineurin-like phosphoesterase family protein
MHQDNTYLISDTHLSHEKMLEYRPFDTVAEMNSTIIENWNSTVDDADNVVFVGDFMYTGCSMTEFKRLLDKLNGDIHFIAGNHDNLHNTDIDWFEIAELTFDNTDFYVCHNPKYIPPLRNTWAIHGHVHDKNTRAYPFINPDRKQVNVSAEIIDYTPVSMSELLEKINRLIR